jgi:pimeloyl-ACP methyl ester carboxylesterase
MPTAHVNGTNINYVQLEPAGSGPFEDLIMVHGLATNMAFWYFQYAPVFAQRFRVTLFDMRGHGRSAMTNGGYTPTALASDVEGLMDELNIERAHFVAHSFGGVVSLCLAQRNRWRIASLVLADSQLSLMRLASEEEWVHGRQIQKLVDRVGIDLDAADPYFGFKLLTIMADRLLRGDELPPEAVDLVGPALGKCGKRTAKQWMDLMTQTRAHRELLEEDGLTPEVLRTFGFPLLALYGDRSRARSSMDMLRPLWPHAHFQTIENAGHFFPASRDREMISACEEFWDKSARHSYLSFLAPPSRPEMEPPSAPLHFLGGRRATG